jgi:hypothetical protein
MSIYYSEICQEEKFKRKSRYSRRDTFSFKVYLWVFIYFKVLKIILNETKLSKCVRYGRTDIIQTILYKISDNERTIASKSNGKTGNTDIEVTM